MTKLVCTSKITIHRNHAAQPWLNPIEHSQATMADNHTIGILQRPFIQSLKLCITMIENGPQDSANVHHLKWGHQLQHRLEKLIARSDFDMQFISGNYSFCYPSQGLLFSTQPHPGIKDAYADGNISGHLRMLPSHIQLHLIYFYGFSSPISTPNQLRLGDSLSLHQTTSPFEYYSTWRLSYSLGKWPTCYS